jgi:hypothetical protein
MNINEKQESQTQIIGKIWLYMAASAGCSVLASIPFMARTVCRAEEKERNEEAI